METRAIRIKPHHFVDIIGALGAGKEQFEPHAYGHALHTVAAEIIANPDVLLEIECGADDICRPCVHNKNGVCDDVIDTSFRPEAPSSKREYNLLLDERWCERLGLNPGDRIVARDFCRRASEALEDLPWIYRELPPHLVSEKAQKLGTESGS